MSGNFSKNYCKAKLGGNSGIETERWFICLGVWFVSHKPRQVWVRSSKARTLTMAENKSGGCGLARTKAGENSNRTARRFYFKADLQKQLAS